MPSYNKGNKFALKHGHSWPPSPTYAAWRNMIQRCTYEKHKNFADYGGRGIKVCKRWLRFENFLADMGEKPNDMTLERKNNDRGYSLSNCCWADRKSQANNRRPHRKHKVPRTQEHRELLRVSNIITKQQRRKDRV